MKLGGVRHDDVAGSQISDHQALLPFSQVQHHERTQTGNRKRETALAHCRELLGTTTCTDRSETTSLMHCPACSGTMLVIERITSAQLYFQPDLSLATPQKCRNDNS
ncbi:hypothetical protein SBA5_600065 [Candidatus Sulfotelmatomonas gaucii]|uniref:Uncharacterized protein n=1 Tax=Candidatus Sulfuritelmatomonas gaucii TaxID=2043161 RepID=A0A2N9LXB6_9BACT|nr:hypothetical protein SBA5_600065 [Candidatus Sulfotelmatomonas gaucii]